MSIFSSLKPKAELSRNAFDLSRRDVFSCKPGMLVPFFVQHTTPNSYYECDNLTLLRTIPIQSPAFARMKVNMEYYFVPYSQIWSGFEKLYYERSDKQRNITGSAVNTSPTEVPTFNMYSLVSSLLECYVGFCYIDYLRWYLSLPINSSGASNYNLLQLLNGWVSDDLIEGFVNTQDVFGRLCIEDILRNFDLLGYGNLLPVFKQFVYAMDAELFNRSAEPVSNFNDYDYSDNIFLLLRDLANNDWQTFDRNLKDFCQYYHDEEVSDFPNWLSSSFAKDNLPLRPNLFSMACVMKVWYDYYRNQQYDVNRDYSQFFNFDYVLSDSQGVIQDWCIIELLKPVYRQWKKDIFTGSYPNAQFGSVAVASLENPSTLFSVNPLADGALFDGPTVQESGKMTVEWADSDRRVISDSWNIDSSVSAVSIRQALAFQRYKERILRAGSRTRNLQTALFGDASRFIQDNYADFLGSSDFVIDINTVASTADSGSSNVGELAANGVGTNGSKAFTYHSHDFGVIIGFFSILPEAEYESFMIDPFNQKSESFDWFKADFQNLGLSPVFNFDFNTFYFSGGGNSRFFHRVLGYLARYWEYKTSVDKVHGEFYSTNPFNSNEWTDLRLGETNWRYRYDVAKSLTVGAFSQFVTPRPSSTFYFSHLAGLYVNPSCVDNIFYVASDERQVTDQFLVNCNHDLKAVLPMSVIGLPV